MDSRTKGAWLGLWACVGLATASASAGDWDREDGAGPRREIRAGAGEARAFDAPTEDEIAELIELTAGEPVARRMEIFSERFIGLPYGFTGPLGESALDRYDQDPLFRFDTFDCTTFVETVTSLARAGDFRAFAGGMDRVRYLGGQVRFVTRNHFPSLDWVPNNLVAGIYRDITREIAPGRVEVARAVINKPAWYAKMRLEAIVAPGLTDEQRLRRLEELRAEGAQFRPEEATLDYIPAAQILGAGGDETILDRIPSGAVISIVWPNRDLVEAIGTHMNVSHQGLAIRVGGVLHFRHATPTGLKQVVTGPLRDYLLPMVNSTRARGIHVLAVNEE